jgi:hypothetical protein
MLNSEDCGVYSGSFWFSLTRSGRLCAPRRIYGRKDVLNGVSRTEHAGFNQNKTTHLP